MNALKLSVSVTYNGLMTTSSDGTVPPEPDWPKCGDGKTCIGIRVDGFEHCLAHLEAPDLRTFLARLRPGANLDARGTPISADLLARILHAVEGDDEPATFGAVSFAQAQFTGDADFPGVRFTEDAKFKNAEFTQDARFGDAQFGGHAWFEKAQFKGHAWFTAARFTAWGLFSDARFAGDAEFAFAEFAGDAMFDKAQFNGNLWCENARFIGDLGCRGALFADYACFQNTRFEQATFLGPLAADRLDLMGAMFARPAVIEAVAATVSCRDATCGRGVTLRLRYADVDLEGATFTESSFLTGFDQPFELHSGQYLNESQVRTRVLSERGESLDLWVPVLRSLRGGDAANLSVTDVDLSPCHLAGARSLDQLRLEGRCIFDHPPRGLRAGWAWPPVWRWSGRQSLAEERNWRATTRKYAGWQASRSGQAAEVRPERLAALYRQLRKAQEDAKNRPGAANFYYGEMEMRRHAPSTSRTERLIIAAYWAISGYGLRASRALVALAALILAAALALMLVGVPRHYGAGYVDCLLYTGGAVLSLELISKHIPDVVTHPDVLTHVGEVIRILLRISGPVLLGLAALAVRGRIRR